MKEERFSFSKVDTFNQCPFKYLLKYVEGHYPKGSSIALEFGTAIHSCEESIANSIKDGTPIEYVSNKNALLKKMYELEHKYPEDFYALDKSGRTYKQKTFEYLEKGIYHLKDFMDKHPQLEIVGAEVAINFRFADKYLFRGSIDRLLRNRETGEYIIHDVKTYNKPLEHDHLTTPLQFVVYAMAVAEMYHCDIGKVTCAYDLPLCDIIQDAGTAGWIKRGTDKLNKLFAGIEAKEFEPKPTALCHWCDFCLTNDNADKDCKFLCPYFCKWTKENKVFYKENEWQGAEAHPLVLEHFKQVHGLAK